MNEPTNSPTTDPNLADMRQDYQQAELDESTLPPNPIDQFKRWFEETCKSGVIEPNAMSLATATASGRTSIRTVLCKGYDDRGFVFYTNLESTKAGQLVENPNISLLFPWLKLERQVIVNGTVEKLSMAEVAKYFITRPVDSQIAAWASQQSQFTTRKMLQKTFSELRQQFASGQVPVPSFWGGFRVIPATIEFWQGRPNRMHDRLLYARQQDGSWTIGRLSP
jgi:pyridoxamine 5'-phosphate oxidase